MDDPNPIPNRPAKPAKLRLFCLFASFGALACAGAALVQVYSEDFEDGLAEGFALNGWRVEAIENAPGTDNSFSELVPAMGSRFLRTVTTSADETAVLQLTGLPPHDSVSIGLIFAAIDSADSEFFAVAVDGVDIFRERVWPRLPLAFPGSNIIDVTLFHQRHAGYNGGTSGPNLWQAESAFDMGAMPAFKDIAHTSSSLTIEILEGLDGPDQADESWAIDNVIVSVNTVAEFGITGIELEGDGQITLTFDSITGRTYGIFYSTDLADWGGDVNDGVDAQGNSTTLTFPNPLPDAPKLFFRVEDLSG